MIVQDQLNIFDNNEIDLKTNTIISPTKRQTVFFCRNVQISETAPKENSYQQESLEVTIIVVKSIETIWWQILKFSEKFRSFSYITEQPPDNFDNKQSAKKEKERLMLQKELDEIGRAINLQGKIV